LEFRVGGEEAAGEVQELQVLDIAPAAEMSAVEFRRTVGSAAGRGEGTEKECDGDGGDEGFPCGD
jgi:hypothetical protein